jgi:signal transduction histidine kinase/ActR/RegA family two-component response regulator
MSVATGLDDPTRLRRLRMFGILDTPAEAHFDALTQLAGHVMRAPVALLNFVDEARTWCKSAWGAKRCVVPREQSLCAHALLTNDALVIPNAREHETYRHHPSVIREPYVAFYAGVVLKTSDGLALGTLCVTDVIPHGADEHDLLALRLIAQQVIKCLEAEQARQHAQHKADVSEAQLASAQRNRDRFLAMLAHELRAPLAPVLTAVQILNRSEINDARRTWAQQLIRRHVSYMSEIVDHLLSASLVSFGAVQLTLEAVPVKFLLDRAIEMSDAAIEAGRHRLTTENESAPWVMADRTQAPLVLSNLLMNAAKYSPDGGQIEILVEADPADVRMVVRDFGIGIAPADMNEIFEVFGQSQQPSNRPMGGLGLGLALSRRLAQWHGGSLTARSDGPNKGSEFTLTLRRSTPQHDVKQAEMPATIPLRPLDILIVEDSPDTADALALYYQLGGHRTRVAYRPSDALAMAAEQAPDVVLSDVGLPEMDGFALARQLRTIASLRDTIFVATTGYAGEVGDSDALDAVFDAHFTKPVDLEQLDRFLRLASVTTQRG